MTEARMQETPEYKPGTFCWVELGTSDSEAAKNFYTELFGWDFVDNPMGQTWCLHNAQARRQRRRRALQLMPDMTAQGIPPHWLSYVAVTNADETAEKAKAAGATMMKEPFDVLTVGRMAVIQDPTGAVFALWQAKDHKGAGIYNVPNSFCWNELGTTDTQKAGDFYSNVFGWTRDRIFGSRWNTRCSTTATGAPVACSRSRRKWDQSRHTGWSILRLTIATRRSKRRPSLARR